MKSDLALIQACERNALALEQFEAMVKFLDCRIEVLRTENEKLKDENAKLRIQLIKTTNKAKEYDCSRLDQDSE